MSDTLDWLCIQIGVNRDELLGERRHKEIINKRKIIINFFHFLKKSSTWIGLLLNRNHATVISMLNNSNDAIYNRALSLIEKYEREINQRNIEELKVETIKKTVWKRVPDYKHSCVVMREFEAEDEPIIHLPPIQNNRGWNK